MQKKGRWPLFAILFASLASCTPKPPDIAACENLAEEVVIDGSTGHLVSVPSPTCAKEVGERSCGHCVRIVSGKDLFVGEKAPYLLDGKPWSVVREQSVLLPAQASYAPLAAYLIDVCKKMNCNDEISRFRVKMGALNTISNP